MAGNGDDDKRVFFAILSFLKKRGKGFSLQYCCLKKEVRDVDLKGNGKAGGH